MRSIWFEIKHAHHKKWQRYQYLPLLPLGEGGRIVTGCKEHIQLSRTAAAEGAVLRNPMELVKRPKCKKTEGHRALEGWERDLITSTYQEHDFGLVAMVMLYAGLRRGEALFLHVDRDVDFEKKTITVSGAVSFSYGNQPVASEGKTASARRTVPLVRPLAHALQGHHGLLCTKKDGAMMSQSAFDRKFASYITFLETKLNGWKSVHLATSWTT